MTSNRQLTPRRPTNVAYHFGALTPGARGFGGASAPTLVSSDSRAVRRSCSSKHVFHRRFTVDAAFASSNYRIRVTNDHQCMHIRGFDLYGTILPPWRID